MLFEIDLGGSDVYLEPKAQQDTRPFTVLRETFMLLRPTRSHRLDNTPAKSTVPANDKMANYKLRVD